MLRPVVLISAVSRELQSSRYVAANSLTLHGCRTIWQDTAPTETGDLKAAIRDGVDRSHAVLQIVGHHHGPSPEEPDEEFGSVSYTQYEALYAHKMGKPVRYILLDENHPTDCENDESEECSKLQSDYRAQVAARQGLCHTSSNAIETKDIVLKLCADFSKAPRFSLKRLPVRIALFLTILSIGTWLFLRQHETDEPTSAAGSITENDGGEDKDASTPSPSQSQSPSDKMESILIRLADAENRSRIPGESLTLEEYRTRAYALLETEFGLPPGTLATSLPALALELYSDPDTGLITRANAAYCLNKFEEAEKLFLEQESKTAPGEENGKDSADLRTQRILALEGAAQFATAQIQYARALEHYRAAAALTSVERDPLEWGRIHHMLAYALTFSGRYSDAAEILSQVIPVYEKHLGAEHPDTLSSANNYANALNSQGKHAEAEQRHRAILSIRERILGPDFPATLTSRSNLAATLNAQGKHSEAADQHRTVLNIRERILSADNRDTLFSRNNLAIALDAQGKHAEAEEHYRAVLATCRRVLGEEHPDTLSSRDNLAKNLRSQKKHAEGEEQIRAALAIRERLLGSGHYTVFLSCHNLALSLAAQKKHTEALVFAKRGLAGFTQSLEADHPNTKAAAKLVSILESRVPPSGAGGSH